MTDTRFVLMPDTVADAFIEKFDQFTATGILDGPVFSEDMSANLLIGIREDPRTMSMFFSQTVHVIRAKMEHREGENSPITLNALLQFESVMFSWFIKPLSACMRDNLEMMAALTGITSPADLPLGIPEGSPKDMFANIEGLDFTNWIGQEPETPETTPPLDPSS